MLRKFTSIRNLEVCLSFIKLLRNYLTRFVVIASLKFLKYLLNKLVETEIDFHLI